MDTATNSTQTAQTSQKHFSDRDSIMNYTTSTFLAANPITLPDLLDDSGDTAETVRAELLDEMKTHVEMENSLREKTSRIPVPNSLPGYIVARIVMSTDAIRTLVTGNQGHRMIARHYYFDKKSGAYKWAGTYNIVDETDPAGPIMKIFQRLCPNGTAHDERTFARELRKAPRVRVQEDNSLVWLRNGVWDYKTRKLTEYNDPMFDSIYPGQIALSKLPVYHPYGSRSILHPDANGFVAEPVIKNPDGTEWRPSQMLTDPFDMDTEEGQASSIIIWQAMQFLVRHMNGAPGLYHFWINANGRGHNGKGAIWAMMHRLIEKELKNGDDDLMSSGEKVIPLAIEALDSDYILAQNIMTAYAIVGEESNGSVTYVDKCATAKMLARAQEVTYRVIRESPFTFRFNGFLLQQSNKAPIFAEKNESVISHTVVIRFEHTFDDSRPYIKDDYVLREEVAEWLMWKLTCDMTCLEEYSKDALKVLEPNKREMLAESMSSIRCMDEIIPRLDMKFMPLEFLYEIYRRWCEKSGEKAVTERMFRDDLEQYGLNNSNGVVFVKGGSKGRRRGAAEDLSKSYDILEEYAYSVKYGRNPFVDQRAFQSCGGRNHFLYQFDKERMGDMSGNTSVIKGRVWNKGGLERTVPFVPEANI